MSDYDLGRHDERRRTMQLIGAVRMDAQTSATGDALDKLVMSIASEPLPDIRAAQPSPTTDARQRASMIVFGADLDEVYLRNTLGNHFINGLLDRIASALQSTAEPVREIVAQWASSNHDAIDDLDALCRIAEVLDVEVKERNATPNAQQQWQPIETAPKDGSPVLLWWPYWYNRTAIWGYYDDVLRRWFAWQTLSAEGDGPTHWLPLPDPPLTPSEVEKEAEHD